MISEALVWSVERELAGQYTSAFRDYLAGAGEEALLRAYELGRRAVADGLGILKIAAVYHEALAGFLLQAPTPQESARVAQRASQFFAESVSPFEMTFRGFEEAIASLRRLNETLEQRVQQRTHELRRLERFSQNIVASVPAGLLVLDGQARVISINQSFLEMFTLPVGATIGRPVAEVLRAIGLSPACIEAIAAAKTAQDMECDRVSAPPGGGPDQGARCLSVSLTPMRFEEEPAGHEQKLLVIEDISARRRAEEELRQAAAEIYDLYNNAPCGYHSLDRDGRYVRVNDTEIEWLGYPREEVIGREFTDFLTPESVRAYQDAFPRFVEQGSVRDVEYGIIRKDGTVMPVLLSATAVHDAAGEFVMSRATFIDLTERKRADQEVEVARQRILQAEVDKKRFNRDVLRAVTNGKFHLADAEEIPEVGNPVADVSLEGPEGYRALRARLPEIAERVGMAPENAGDLALAASEAITNAIKHATQGRCVVYTTPEQVVVRVCDHGTGIHPEDLPGAILRPGFSTKVSLGMGYTLMLGLTDALWLATGPEGTVVQIEKWIRPEEHAEPTLPMAWDRL